MPLPFAANLPLNCKTNLKNCHLDNFKNHFEISILK